VKEPQPGSTKTARGAPDWRPTRGEPDWVFECYRASAWPHFIRRMFELHKLLPEEQRFDTQSVTGASLSSFRTYPARTPGSYLDEATKP